MLLLAFLITASAAVIAQDLLGVSYHYDSNYLNFFSETKCENSTRWELVSYDHLEIVQPYGASSMAIRALRNSCITSFPIVFVNGTLELTVYLRIISKYSGITIGVFDEKDNAMVLVKYQRRNKNFITGWTVIALPITKHARGYVQLSGQSLSSELVLIDSLRYTPDNTTTIFKDEKPSSTEILSSPAQTSLFEDNIEDEQLIFEFDEINGSGASEEIIDGSGGSNEIPESPGTEDLDNQTDAPISSTDDPGSAEVIDNPDEPRFWNTFTITLVSVGGFVVVGSVGVGTYYLGKNAGMSESPPLDLEALQTPSEIIPRVRSVYTAPSERFSRFS